MKKSIISILLFLFSGASIATNPASTDYVNRKFAAIQAQIDAILEIIANLPVIAHPVGSCFGGGVVFYVNTDPAAPPGQRGLIAALTDASCPAAGCQWDAGGVINAVITTTPYFSGLSNTNAIIAFAAGSPGIQAALAANSYTTVETCDTCTPWYLPSRDEISTLWNQYDSIGDSFWTNCAGTPFTPGKSYWSSSQAFTNPLAAWNQGITKLAAPLTLPIVNIDPTTTQHLVRAIRAF